MFHVERRDTGRCTFEGKDDKDGLVVRFDQKGAFPDGLYCWPCIKKITAMLSSNGNGHVADEATAARLTS